MSFHLLTCSCNAYLGDHSHFGVVRLFLFSMEEIGYFCNICRRLVTGTVEVREAHSKSRTSFIPANVNGKWTTRWCNKQHQATQGSVINIETQACSTNSHFGHDENTNSSVKYNSGTGMKTEMGSKYGNGSCFTGQALVCILE